MNNMLTGKHYKGESASVPGAIFWMYKSYSSAIQKLPQKLWKRKLIIAHHDTKDMAVQCI